MPGLLGLRHWKSTTPRDRTSVTMATACEADAILCCQRPAKVVLAPSGTQVADCKTSAVWVSKLATGELPHTRWLGPELGGGAWLTQARWRGGSQPGAQGLTVRSA